MTDLSVPILNNKNSKSSIIRLDSIRLYHGMTHYSTFAILLLLFTYAKPNMRKVFKCLDLHCGGEPGKILL